jgi:C4-dicarboxylate-specific signal transduction histidine kinase
LLRTAQANSGLAAAAPGRRAADHPNDLHRPDGVIDLANQARRDHGGPSPTSAETAEINATIVHEVNKPLTAILANGQACLRFLRRDPPDLDDVRGAVEWIVRDAKRAAGVIEGVRGLLRKTDVQKVPLDLNEVIDEVRALLHRELTSHEVSFRLALAPCLPAIVGNRLQLQQVIINLIMNAVEATQGVAGRRPSLLVRSFHDEARGVVVAVTDNGIGLADGQATRLFDAFFSTKASGLGMGLSICRSIIEDHGGQMSAANNGGEPGATFEFALLRAGPAS